MNPTRRALLLAAAAATLTGCPPINVVPLPAGSPLRRGPFQVGRAILGVTRGTAELPLEPVEHFNGYDTCSGPVLERPKAIRSAVLYPAVNYSEDVSRDINQNLAAGPFPLILYAHARRPAAWCPPPPGVDGSAADLRQDYLKVDHMLAHVASYGFIVAVPDIGWMSQTFDQINPDHPGPRAQILEALFHHLHARRDSVFGGQLDTGKVALFGHSTGAQGCLSARRRISGVGLLGLIAPATGFTGEVDPAQVGETPPTMIIMGTRDRGQVGNPYPFFQALSLPRICVSLGGANHFGYTQLCSVNNEVCPGDDLAGTIGRIVQMEGAGAYLAAAARHYLSGDADMRRFLDGEPTGAEQYFPSLTVERNLT